MSTREARRDRGGRFPGRRTFGADEAFVLGDFNSAPQSPAWTVLVEEGGLQDAWPELGLPEEGTSHGFTGVAGGARIDWILHTQGWVATEASVVKDSAEGHYPSDHFPVQGVYAPDPAR